MSARPNTPRSPRTHNRSRSRSSGSECRFYPSEVLPPPGVEIGHVPARIEAIPLTHFKVKAFSLKLFNWVSSSDIWSIKVISRGQTVSSVKVLGPWPIRPQSAFQSALFRESGRMHSWVWEIFHRRWTPWSGNTCRSMERCSFSFSLREVSQFLSEKE